MAAPRNDQRRAPVLRTTRHDVVSSFLTASVLGLILLVVVLSVLWTATWPRRTIDAVPVELIDVTGGFADGAVDETLEIDTPDDPSDDPALADVVDEKLQVEEAIETVVELSETAAEQVQERLQEDALNAGTPGSTAGTGRRPLGLGSGSGGVPRSNRWFVAFADDTLAVYAAQLEFFGIRVGVRLGAEIVFLTNLTTESPGSEVVRKGNPNWLFFTWRGGGRRKADLMLFRKANVDPAAGEIIHLYSARAEEEMARVELAAAKGRAVDEIRRTYFTVVPDAADGFRFAVTRQTYFN